MRTTMRLGFTASERSAARAIWENGSSPRPQGVSCAIRTPRRTRRRHRRRVGGPDLSTGTKASRGTEASTGTAARDPTGTAATVTRSEERREGKRGEDGGGRASEQQKHRHKS